MKLLKCLLALLLVPLPVFAAASFDVANASYSANYGNTSITFNGTVGATDNFLVVIVNNDYVGTIGDPTPITFNGTAITKLNEQGCNTYFYQYVYYMVNPPTGTHSLTMNFNGTYNTSVLFLPMTGVNTSTPFGTPVFSCLTGTVTTAAATASGGGSNDVYLGAAFMDTATISDTGSNMVNIQNFYNFSTSSADYILGTNSGVFSWSGTGGNQTTSIGVAVAVKGATSNSFYFLHQ